MSRHVNILAKDFEGLQNAAEKYPQLFQSVSWKESTKPTMKTQSQSVSLWYPFWSQQAAKYVGTANTKKFSCTTRARNSYSTHARNHIYLWLLLKISDITFAIISLRLKIQRDNLIIKLNEWNKITDCWICWYLRSIDRLMVNNVTLRTIFWYF